MKKHVFFFLLFLTANLSLAQTVGLYEVDLVPTSTNLTVSGGNTITVNRVLANCLPNYSSSCETNLVNYLFEIVLDNGTDQYELVPLTFNYIEGQNCPNTQAWYQPSTSSLDMIVPCSVPTGNYTLKVICHSVISFMTQQNSQITPSTVHVKAGGTTLANAVSSSQVTSADIANVSVTNSSQYITDITFGTANSVCSGVNSGWATAYPVGGTGNYSYLWSNGQTTPTATNLSSGTYTVVITDINSGCPTSSSDFNSGAQIGYDYNFTVSLTTLNMCDNNPGSISTTVTGVPQYDYQWSTGEVTPNISNLSMGNYSVEVVDGNGCTASASTEIIQSHYPAIFLGDEMGICNKKYKLCGPIGETTSDVYTYSWYFNDPVLFQSFLVTNNRCFQPILGYGYGSYTLMVSNQYGCTSTHTINIVPGKGCDGLDPDPSDTQFNIYPNPVEIGQAFTIEMNSKSESSIVEIVNITTGKVVYESVLEYGKPLQYTIMAPESVNAPSVYFVKIYNDTEIVTKRLVIK